ncbi:hypothetical protein GCM10010512_13210 [Streptomyces thermoviolaceus subsp. thermoviolaceus]|nr:hypothetical protein GCM10010512_13210 [Streptomyces thermoviolaceus subsp. thermoviolaceus]
MNGPPPAARAPTSANWEAPVNTSRLSAQVWGRVKPLPAEVAPKAKPDRPTAMPTARASRTTAVSGFPAAAPTA